MNERPSARTDAMNSAIRSFRRGLFDTEDHRRQMRNEKPEAICPLSESERHTFQIAYDQFGRPNYQPGQVVTCEACHARICQDGARWVTTDGKLFRTLPQLVIQEPDSIEDILSLHYAD